MNRVEREELLRRYLDGAMSTGEEHDFLIQAALDKELRHELQAQQTIERAFRKDRTTAGPDYARLQTSISAMLATHQIPSGGEEEPEPVSPPNPGPLTGPSATGILSRLQLFRLAGFGSIILLLAGLALFLPWNDMTKGVEGNTEQVGQQSQREKTEVRDGMQFDGGGDNLLTSPSVNGIDESMRSSESDQVNGLSDGLSGDQSNDQNQNGMDQITAAEQRHSGSVRQQSRGSNRIERRIPAKSRNQSAAPTFTPPATPSIDNPQTPPTPPHEMEPEKKPDSINIGVKVDLELPQ